MLIAIDTATKYLGLALYTDDVLIAEQMWRTGNKHNQILAPSIQQLLMSCDVGMTDLTAVAVANGPGSYTGLRIGVAMAKGLATMQQLPLIGVNTLDIIAAGQTFSNTRHRLLTIIPAGRKRVIAGVYRVKKGRWVADGDADIYTWDDLLSSLTESSYYIAGEIDAAGLDAIAAYNQSETTLTLIDAAQRGRRPAVLAREAWQIYHEGDAENFLPAKLAPVYLKAPG